jgi:hypothetical protein
VSVVTFTDYMPKPRFDGIPWTIIRIAESALADGPWVEIDEINIPDPDADPSQPEARSFTTDNATLDVGWYQITFQDVHGEQTISDPVQNVAPTQELWYPALSDVGLEILSRTKDSFGNELGTFTANTRPTETQVLALIRKAALDVADVVGDVIPTALEDDAANVVAKRAAMMIERTYFSDQVNTGRSVYPQLKEEYTSSLMTLQRQITLIGEGETRVGDAGPSLAPSYHFPHRREIFRERW